MPGLSPFGLARSKPLRASGRLDALAASGRRSFRSRQATNPAMARLGHPHNSPT